MTRTKEPGIESPGSLVHQLEMALEAQRGVEVAMLVDRVIKADAWRTFTRPYERAERKFTSFASFVSDRRGLGLTTDQLRFFCASTPRILSDLDALIRQRSKEPPSPEPPNAARHRGLQRLREERPDIYKRVDQGELSPNAGMIEAGFRHRTATVPVDDVASVARFLERRFSSSQLQKLIKLLSGEHS